MGVPAEPLKEMTELAQGHIQIKTIYASSGSHCRAILDVKDQCGAVVFVHKPRRHDTQNPFMPLLPCKNQSFEAIKPFRGFDQTFYLFKDIFFHILPLVIHSVRFQCEIPGHVWISNSEHLKSYLRITHSAWGIQAGRESKGQIIRCYL